MVKLKIFQIIYYKKNILIDLAADFRLKNLKNYLKWYKIKHSAIKNIKKSIYALPEIKKKILKIIKLFHVQDVIQLQYYYLLIPLIKKNLINNKNIIIDSKSGYSGAGRGVHKKYAKNKNFYESLSAYGISNFIDIIQK